MVAAVKIQIILTWPSHAPGIQSYSHNGASLIFAIGSGHTWEAPLDFGPDGIADLIDRYESKPQFMILRMGLLHSENGQLSTQVIEGTYKTPFEWERVNHQFAETRKITDGVPAQGAVPSQVVERSTGHILPEDIAPKEKQHEIL
jgi:hypothetical protein